MARWDFKLPDIGEGVAEGEIVSWLVRPGDVVREDQGLIELMTDKATVTITAPRAGTVVETRGRVGEVVAVHSVLIVFEVGHDPPGPQPLAASAASPTAHTNGHHAPGGVENGGAHPHAEAASTIGSAEQPLATPATRRHARELDVDLRRVTATGPLGRVTRGDVEAFARSRSAPPRLDDARVPGEPAEPAALQGPPPADLPAGPSDTGAAEEERVPFVGMRRKIAQKMAQSKATAAHFTFVEECDASELKALRARLIEPARAQGVELTYLPIIIRAVVASLRKHPVLASTLDEARGELVFRKSFGIGVATATPAGLMVPVVKDADRKNLLTIARDIERMASEARAGKSKLEDLQGSTFTVTSLGAQGGLLATPIINFPEVAILGVHRIKERPVVKAGQIVVGDVMTLSLSFDHRIVDGHVGAAFAYEVIAYLEHPERLMLE